MALPSGTTISVSQINSELGASAGRSINFDNGTMRSLAGRGSGSISMSNFWGKSNAPPPSTLSAYGVQADSTGYGTGSTQFQAYCYPRVYPSGGTGNYSYSWSITSTDGNTGYALYGTNAATSQNPQVGHIVGKFGFQGYCYLQCIVSDGQRSVVVSNVLCNWDYQYG